MPSRPLLEFAAPDPSKFIVDTRDIERRAQTYRSAALAEMLANAFRRLSGTSARRDGVGAFAGSVEQPVRS